MLTFPRLVGRRYWCRHFVLLDSRLKSVGEISPYHSSTANLMDSASAKPSFAQARWGTICCEHQGRDQRSLPTGDTTFSVAQWTRFASPRRSFLLVTSINVRKQFNSF